MAMQLPSPIDLFFQMSNNADGLSLERCFATDASVRDERRTHRGIGEITAWFIDAKKKYSYTTEPLEMEEQDNDVIVQARVSGNFPGSPVVLRYVFQLSDHRIESLHIG